MANAQDNNGAHYPQSEAATSINSIFSRIRIHQIDNFVFREHAANSLNRVKTYFRDQRLTDVTLVAGTKRIPAHRLVLCTASDYFAEMFTSSMREPVQNEVELTEVDGEALLTIVEYCYTGRLELRGKNLETLFKTAHLLQINPVIEACCQFLKGELDPSNCLGIQMFAAAHGCNDLSNKAYIYAMKNFVEVIKNEEFLSLPAKKVARFLQSEELNVPSEETIFHALMTWIKHDLQNRTKNASKLLSYVKLPLLSPDFIVAHIASNELFCRKKSVRDSIIEAFKYQLVPKCKPPLQSPRTQYRKYSVSLLIAIGTTSINAFSVENNAWKNLASMSNERRYFGVTVLEKNLVIAGGLVAKNTTNTVQSFNFFRKSWNTLSPMNTPRESFGIAVLNGSLYAVGGYNGSTVLDTVEKWDPITCQWRYVAPLMTARSGLGVAVLNNKLYAVGGRPSIWRGSSVMECYDPQTNKWTLCAPMIKSRRGVNVGVLNELLYVLGGYEESNCLDSVERYDPKTNTWSMVAPMSMPRCRVGACALRGRLFAVGGLDRNFERTTLVEAYNPDLNEWQEVPPLNVASEGPCVVLNGFDFSNLVAPLVRSL